jgi:hypothetical protein
MLRTGAALVLLACLTSPRPAAAEERHALVVSGVSGSEKFAESQKTWVSTLRTTLEQRMGFGADRITVLSEGGAGAAVGQFGGLGTAVVLAPRLQRPDDVGRHGGLDVDGQVSLPFWWAP